MGPLVPAVATDKGGDMTTTVDPSPGTDQAFGTNPGDPTRAAFLGGPAERLSEEQVTDFVTEAFGDADLDGASVCLVVPDGTRTCPLPLLLRCRPGRAGGPGPRGHRRDRARYAPRDERGAPRPAPRLRGRSERSDLSGLAILNHESWLPDTFTSLGTIGADRLTELTGGLMTGTRVEVRINRHVAEADVAIVVGPVFPHEVVGFSGGNKYFFPGVSGPGADRPVALGRRADHQCGDDRHPRRHPGPGPGQRGRHADPGRRLALCLVVASGTDTLHAAAFGTPEDAWAACAEVSAETHVTYRDTPGPAGAVDHAHQVRGHLDRGQGLLQARADRRRRRRGDHLRPAHHRRSR